MTNLRYFLSGIVIFLLSQCSVPSDNQDADTETSPSFNTNILSLSDIHFNPFCDPTVVNQLAESSYKDWGTIFQQSGDTTYGKYNVDSNYKLFASAVDRAKSTNPSPEFIVITGDFVTHEFETLYDSAFGNLEKKGLDQFITKTIKFVSHTIQSAFPNTTIYAGLGNNDAYCGDYQITPKGTFLENMSPTWYGMVKDNVDSAEFFTTFKKGGYYTATAPNDDQHKMIILNTIMLSPKFQDTSIWRKNYCQLISKESATQAAQEQLTWFENELKSAKESNQSVWVMYHIPPGINAFSTNSSSAASCSDKISLYYDENWNTQFLNIVNQYASTIKAQFGGHSHMDNFIVIKEQNGNPSTFVHITPAVSPIFQNNPGFLNYTYNKSNNKLVDYEAQYFNGIEFPNDPQWKLEYTFSDTYKQNELTAASLNQVATNIGQDTTLAKHYIDYYIVDDVPNSSINSSTWTAYYCALTATTVKEYSDCYCKQ